VVSKLVLVALAALAVSACSSTRPAERTAPRAYFTAPVFRGDSLATFAQRYGVQPEDILALNKVRQRNGRLASGQLKVPTYTRAREAQLALPVQPAVVTPRVAATQARPASIETRSLSPVTVTSARNASVTTNGLDTQKTAPAGL
jgi:LysM repeat protein